MPGLTPYTPEIDNPYPDEWREITGFRIDTPTKVMRPKPPDPSLNRPYRAQYYTTCDYVVSCHIDGEWRTIRAPSGMLTDLATIPFPVSLFVRRKGKHLPAALIHDYLSIAWQDVVIEGAPRGARERDFHFSNQVLREALLALDYPRWLVRIVVWAAGGGWARRRYDAENNDPRYVKVGD